MEYNTKFVLSIAKYELIGNEILPSVEMTKFVL